MPNKSLVARFSGLTQSDVRLKSLTYISESCRGIILQRKAGAFVPATRSGSFLCLSRILENHGQWRDRLVSRVASRLAGAALLGRILGRCCPALGISVSLGRFSNTGSNIGHAFLVARYPFPSTTLAKLRNAFDYLAFDSGAPISRGGRSVHRRGLGSQIRRRPADEVG